MFLQHFHEILLSHTQFGFVLFFFLFFHLLQILIINLLLMTDTSYAFPPWITLQLLNNWIPFYTWCNLIILKQLSELVDRIWRDDVLFLSWSALILYFHTYIVPLLASAIYSLSLYDCTNMVYHLLSNIIAILPQLLIPHPEDTQAFPIVITQSSHYSNTFIHWLMSVLTNILFHCQLLSRCYP